MPACIRRHEPRFLLDLIDGLEAIDGSLYRAWRLEQTAEGNEDDQSNEPPELSFLSYSQDSMLMLSTLNTLELIRVMLARYMGDKKAEPALIPPPGAKPTEDEGTHLSLDLSQATAKSMFAFLMKSVS